MKNYGKVHSLTKPEAIEITDTKVLIAENIQEVVLNYDNHTLNSFEYDYKEYDKNEYLLQLAEELQAAKILLGVE